MKNFFILLFLFVVPYMLSGITKVFIDTDYKVNYIDYLGLDFDNSTNDNFNHTYSFLKINLITNIDEIEFYSKLASLGSWGYGGYQIDGSTNISFAKTYNWQKNLPYPETNFSPWFEEFYIKYNYKFERIPYVQKYIEKILFSASLGRQELEFVDGLVLGNNGIGYDSINLFFTIDNYAYLQTFASKILTDGYLKNYALFGTLLGTKYFSEFDFGFTNIIEKNDFLDDEKIFYEYFIKRDQGNVYYIFEYAMQQGQKGNNNVIYNGSLWYAKAGVKGRSKMLGKSNAEVVWLLSSGGDEGLRFSPTFCKAFNGIEPVGYGNFAAGNTKELFFGLPPGYSGMFILGLDISVEPIKNLVGGFNYYLYASPEGPADKPEPSATEKTLGAKRAIGLEYGVTAKYNFSRYINFSFFYSLFNPMLNVYPNYPKGDPAGKLKFTTEIKF